MTKSYSNLQMLNSIIGFCKDRGSLRSIGYNRVLIEVKIGNKVGTIVADLLVHSQRLDHTQICELKSGESFDEDQAKIYNALDPNLMDRFLSFAHPKNNKYDVSYVCHSENVDHISNKLKESRVDLPVLEFHYKESEYYDYLSLKSGKFSENTLNELMKSGIKFKLEEVYEWIKFDTSSDFGTIFKNITNVLLKYALRKRQFSIELILHDVFGEWWGSMNSGRKKELKSKLRDTLNQAFASGKMAGILTESSGCFNFESSENLLNKKKKLEEVAEFLRGVQRAQPKLPLGS